MTYRNRFSQTHFAAFTALALSTACGSGAPSHPANEDCVMVGNNPVCFARFDGGTPANDSKGGNFGGGGTPNRGTAPDRPQETSTDAGADAPFTRTLTTLVSQPVPFSVAVVTITGARVTNEDPTLPSLGTFAELDLSIQNNDTSDLDWSGRSTWDLELADGSRIHSTEPLGTDIAAGYTAKTTVTYRVANDATLAGAKLVLDGDQVGQKQPELVPLDAKWSSIYPIDLKSLDGKRFVPSSPGVFEVSELDIDRGRVELNDMDEGRADLGQKWIRLDMVAQQQGSGEVNAGGDLFRIIVDGLSSAPTNVIDVIIQPNASQKFPIIFEVDESVQHFDFRISSPTQTRTFHVDLSPTGDAGAATPDAGTP